MLDRILSLINRCYEHPFHDLPFPAGWWALPSVQEVKRELVAYLADHIRSRPFGLKDPRISRMLPLWIEIFQELGLEPSFCVCIRNPAEIAESLHRRDGLDLRTGEYRWFCYMTDILRTLDIDTCCVIDYEDWFIDTKKNLDLITKFVAKQNLVLTSDIKLSVENIVDLSLRHQKLDSAKIQLPLARKLYHNIRSYTVDSSYKNEIINVCRTFDMFQQMLIHPLENIENNIVPSATDPINLMEHSSQCEASSPTALPELRSCAPRTMNSDDIERFYNLALGRSAETKAVLHREDGATSALLCREFFSSTEFHERVILPIAQRLQPSGGAFDAPPKRDLIEWAAAVLPLTPEGARRLLDRHDSWLSLYHAIFSDPLMTETLAPLAGLQQFTKSLAATIEVQRTYEVKGVIEGVNDLTIWGWALDARAPNRRLLLKLFVDGKFAGVYVPSEFRRGLQDEFGGNGVFGFIIPIPAGSKSPTGQMHVHILEHITGAVIGSTELRSPLTDDYPLENLRKEINHVRNTIDNLSIHLPKIYSEVTFPLINYCDYYNTYYKCYNSKKVQQIDIMDHKSLHFQVILDVFECPTLLVEEILEKFSTQTYSGWSLSLLFREDETALLIFDLVTRLTRWNTKSSNTVRCVPSRVESVSERAGAALDVEADIVLVIDSRTLPSNDALSRACRAFTEHPQLAAVYTDEDCFDPDDQNLHFDPKFKTAFDIDLLRQTNCVGTSIFFRVPQLLAAGGFDPMAGNAFAAAAVLRMADQGFAIGHIPRVLFSRRKTHPSNSASWSESIRRDIPVRGPSGSFGVYPNLPGLATPQQTRTRNAHGSDHMNATVIIPTRDGFELLQQCIPSLEATRYQNRIPFEIVIIDNGSERSDTLEYLQLLKDESRARILRYEVPFNWSLLNNMAVEESDGEVLIFLNDDTVVLSPEWCDALCEQARRGDVGAVGAKLLYPDGTVQHTGVVLSSGIGTFEGDGFAFHEGIGNRGDDPGYLGRNTFVRRASAVTGACLAARASVFRGVGGFDAINLPIDGSDVDYCLRVSESGLKVIYTPHAMFTHLESKSRGFSRDGIRQEAAQAANRLLWKRWGTRLDPFYNAHFDRAARPFTHLRPPPDISVVLSDQVSIS
jgi:GT2 family glycosyltransferase